MRKISLVMSRFLPVLFLMIVMMPAQAQPAIPPFAAFQNGGLIYEDGAGRKTSIMSADYIGHMVWNQDGTRFAFVRYTETPNQNSVSELGVADVLDVQGEGGLLQTLHLAWGYTGSWMRDGRLLFAVENPESNPVTGLHDKIDLMATYPGDSPEFLGTFLSVGECGGGSSFPASWRYSMEIGGLDSFRTLADTPHGILYSPDCAGSQLALMDPSTGESTLFADYLTKAVVSPNGEFVAGIERNYSVSPLVPKLAVVDIASGQSRVIPTEAEPKLVSWSRDGESLYYSTQTYEQNLLENISEEHLAQFNAAYGFELGYVPVYTVSVHRVDLAAASASLVYEGDAYVITRISEAEGAVFISQIPNMTRWVEGIRLGEIAVEDFQANLAAVQTEVIIVERADSVFGDEHFLGYFEQFTPFAH